MGSSTETFQITPDQAEFYEAKFVPAIFGTWAPYVVETAGVKPGDRVLDVACGTGVVARAAADRAGPDGQVTGLDLNEAMLAVARREAPDLTWRQGDAAALPWPDGAFDVVLCQSALMFFPDPTAALREMARVVMVGGTVGVQVYSSLDAQPGYRLLVETAAKHAGPEAVSLLGTYWVHGDLSKLRSMLTEAGLEVTGVHTRLSTATFDSIDELVQIEVGATPLAGRLDAATLDAIVADCRQVLARFQTPAGSLAMPLEGHVVIASKPA